jgi:hypothetical protein
VVPEKYRIAYAERGNAAHCGDWIAATLDGAFDDEEVGFLAGAFELFLRQNGVPIEGKWADLPNSGQQGWKGRYRMNGRQLLEKYVARAGVMLLNEATLEVPADELAFLRTKHAKWIAKQDKADAAKAEATA